MRPGNADRQKKDYGELCRGISTNASTLAKKIPHEAGENFPSGEQFLPSREKGMHVFATSYGTACDVQRVITDEVARNGALQRITSARGFLGRPLHISRSFS